MKENWRFKLIYWTVLAGIILLAVILEIVPVLDGILESGTMTEFYLQYALIAITLGSVYAALKMIKRNPILRMALLEGPAIANIFCYHLFMNASFGYLAIICVLAFVFVYPAKQPDEDQYKKTEK